ncbi:MAG: hypothetical protein ACLRVU_01020 [Beduini sp.]|uniref:hypothetical protein n=1 Tax=Beduini sp. TaxID=1922300 RepID=UPI00399FC5E0
MDNNEYFNTEALENMSKSLIEVRNALEPITRISASIIETLQPLMEFLAEVSKLVKRFYSQSIPNYTITNENSSVINVGVNDHSDISTAPPIEKKVIAQSITIAPTKVNIACTSFHIQR